MLVRTPSLSGGEKGVRGAEEARSQESGAQQGEDAFTLGSLGRVQDPLPRTISLRLPAHLPGEETEHERPQSCSHKSGRAGVGGGRGGRAPLLTSGANGPAARGKGSDPGPHHTQEAKGTLKGITLTFRTARVLHLPPKLPENSTLLSHLCVGSRPAAPWATRLLPPAVFVARKGPVASPGLLMGPHLPPAASPGPSRRRHPAPRLPHPARSPRSISIL